MLERFEQVGAGGYCREGNVLAEDWQKPLDSPMLLLQILVEHLIGRPHQFAYLLQSLNQHIARHDKHRGTQLLIGNETILLICRLARGRRGEKGWWITPLCLRYHGWSSGWLRRRSQSSD